MVKTSLQRFLRETIPFIFLAEKVSSKILWFILCLQRLFEKIPKKKLEGSRYQKISEKICTTESLKRHSQPKDWEEESRPKAFEDLITKMPSKTFLLPKIF